MQDIDQHMEDIFRKAAADYPLRIQEGDWGAIAKQVNGNEKPAGNKRPARYGRVLFLFLFLFTGGMFMSREPYGVKKAAVTNATVTNMISETVKPRTRQTPGETHSRPAQSLAPVERRFAGMTRFNVDESFAAGNKSTAEHDEENNVRTAPHAALAYTRDLKNHWIVIDTKHKLSLAGKTSSPGKRLPKNRSLYAGLVFGPEANQVKGQKLNKCGFDAGLTVGYSFNERLSLETGVLFAKKHYFSEGTYFNMQMPGMKIVSLQGNSTVIEVPLKVKYNVVVKEEWNLFSSAGISSYLLSNERNNYLLLVNGTRQNMISNYENKSRYFAAAVDISLGFELKAGNKLRLRVQPYLQVPLKGIGVGSMPVQSMGLHAGFTHTFR